MLNRNSDYSSVTYTVFLSLVFSCFDAIVLFHCVLATEVPLLLISERYLGPIMLKQQETTSISALAETDSVLDKNVETVLDDQYTRGETLGALGEALTNSYEGHPDMIKIILGWCQTVDVDGIDLLRDATASVWRAQEQQVAGGLEPILLASGKPHPMVQPVATDPYWKTVAAGFASRHSTSAFAYQLNRERRLVDAHVSLDIYNSPKGLARFVCDMFRAALTDGPPSNRRLSTLYDRLALVASYDECVALAVLRFLAGVLRNAEDPFVRAVAHTAVQRVRLSIVTLARQADPRKDKTPLAMLHARRYAVRLGLLVDCAVHGAQLDRAVMDAILSLLLPIDRSHAARRRLDKPCSTLMATYSTLLGKLTLIDENDRDGHVNGHATDHGSAIGNTDDIDEHILDGSNNRMGRDNDTLIGDDDDVVETVTESKAPVQTKVVLMRALCYPEIRDDVVKELFTMEFRGSKDNAMDLKRRRCLTLVLAVSGVVCVESDKGLYDKLESTEGKKNMRTEIGKLYRTLRRTADGCARMRPKPTVLRLHSETLAAVRRDIQHALVARGVLAWAVEGLQVSERAVVANCSKHLAFLEAVVCRHDLLLHPVISALRRVFVRDHKQLPVGAAHELRTMFIDCISTWSRFSIGRAVLVVFATEWADDVRIEGKYLCRFVDRVLENVAPPFSKAFANVLLNVLQHARVEQALSLDRKLMCTALDMRKRIYDSVG